MQPLLSAQVLAPHTAACLGRVYRGAAADLDIVAASAPLSALLGSWEAPQPRMQQSGATTATATAIEERVATESDRSIP